MPAQRILVVDDDPFIIRILSLAFDREGYETITAVDGHEAMVKVRELQPSVVFVDIMMPGKDGFQVCEEIRNDSSLTRQPYIIMLTARGMVTDQRRAELSGADEYMTKPFRPSQLARHVRNILE